MKKIILLSFGISLLFLSGCKTTEQDHFNEEEYIWENWSDSKIEVKYDR
jgi:hypothetical protein